MRQRREPAAHPGGGAAERGCNPLGPGRDPFSPCPAIPDRERAAWPARRDGWVSARNLGGEDSVCLVSRRHPPTGRSSIQLAGPAFRLRGLIAGIHIVRQHSRHAVCRIEFAGSACGGQPHNRDFAPSTRSLLPGDCGSGARHDVARRGRSSGAKFHSVAAG